MPVTVIEIVGSRSTEVSVDAPSQELLFKATGSDNEPEVRQAVEAELPGVINITSAFFGTIPIVIQSYKVDHLGSGTWDGRATYGRIKPRLISTQNSHDSGSSGGTGGGGGNDTQPNGSLILSFDGTGGTQHIQTSKETVAKYSYDNTIQPPSFKQAIGVGSDQVEGVDITVPVCKFKYTYNPHSSLMTGQYILSLIGMAGSTNHATWKGFAAGEVLYLGATGQERGSQDWEVSLHFLASPNQVNLSIGDIHGIAKKGHDYLWIKYRATTDQHHHVQRPAFAYVERVYEPRDFRILGIGP